MTGALVAMAEKKGLRPAGPDAGGHAVRAWRITQGVFDVLGVHNSVASRLSHGGTAPARVREEVARWKEILG